MHVFPALLSAGIETIFDMRARLAAPAEEEAVALLTSHQLKQEDAVAVVRAARNFDWDHQTAVADDVERRLVRVRCAPSVLPPL